MPRIPGGSDWRFEPTALGPLRGRRSLGAGRTEHAWLGASEAGDPRGASWLAVATHRRYLQMCAARAFRDRDFDKNLKSAVEESTGRPRPKGRGTG